MCFKWFCTGEFPAQNWPFSFPSFLDELQIVSITSLYSLQVTDKGWYGTATECFVCLETKHWWVSVYFISQVFIQLIGSMFIQHHSSFLNQNVSRYFFICDTDTMAFSNQIYNSFKTHICSVRTIYHSFQSKWGYYSGIINYSILDI